jgi:hypothetical protein
LKGEIQIGTIRDLNKAEILFPNGTGFKLSFISLKTNLAHACLHAYEHKKFQTMLNLLKRQWNMILSVVEEIKIKQN